MIQKRFKLINTSINNLVSKDIRFPEGFRLIKKSDIKVHIKTFVAEMDRYSVEDYYKWSLDEHSLVIVRELEGNIAGVVYLTIRDQYIMIEMLVRNKLLDYKGAGGELVRVVEKHVAPFYKKKEIRLESLDEVTSYYSKYLGYEQYDKPYTDTEWSQILNRV